VVGAVRKQANPRAGTAGRSRRGGIGRVRRHGTPPGPDPALGRLDRFVGAWEVRGRTLDAEEDNVSGRLTFEWLPGGFFLEQRVQLNFMGLDIAALEVIGYEAATGRFPSTVFASMLGTHPVRVRRPG
jgi:hypothetical protein